MLSSDTTCTQRPQAQGPRLRLIVNDGRTAETDFQYHVKADRAFREFSKLVDLAEEILANGEPRYANPISNRIRELRRLLFEEQVAVARQCLTSLSDDDDAFSVWTAAERSFDELADTIFVFRVSPSKPDRDATIEFVESSLLGGKL